MNFASSSTLAPAGRPIAILGGGITGLSAAWELQRADLPVVLFEGAPRPGGVIESTREAGWLHESGPNSVLEGPPELAAMIRELGLAPRQLFAGSAAKNRYVVRRGRLVPMPSSPGTFLRTPLFSLRAKLRLASEIFRPRGRHPDTETVADFTVRRLGREFLDYAIDPFVGGVYAGDPARLSVRHAFPKLLALEQDHGSLLRGALAKRNSRGGPAGRLFSFPDGLEELPRALAAALGPALRLQTKVLAVRREAGAWLVTFERGGERRTESFAAVVCALPADALARLPIEGTTRPQALSVLAEIEHPAVASVFTGFRREDLTHSLAGFGLLAPKVERRNLLGTLFSSSLFPGRAPAGHVALTTFVGGCRQPTLSGLNDAALLRLVQAELVSLVGARAEPVYVRVRRHARAIPQYTVGFERFKMACAQMEAEAPGLFIGGNCRDGVALSACLASGQRLARAVAASFAKSTVSV